MIPENALDTVDLAMKCAKEKGIAPRACGG